MELTKINNIKVNDLTPQNGSGKRHKYYDMYPNQWFNMFICAKKKSGKTNLIYNILKKIVNVKKTFVFIYCSTVDKDQTYLDMVKFFREKGINIMTNTSIHNEDPEKNEFSLDTVVAMMSEKQEQEDDDEEDEPEPLIIKLKEISKERKKRKPKPIEHDYIIILDDLSNETRDKSVGVLMKKNRHFKSRVIISSQYVNDLEPQAMKQVDYFLLLGGHSDDKIALVHKHGDSSLDLDKFIDMYRNATEKKYNFLYWDTANEEYRKNFDQKYHL